MVWTSFSNNDLWEFYDRRKDLRTNSWCRFKIEDNRQWIENFKKVKWLPFYDDVKINKCVLLYKVWQGESSMYINDLLITNRSVHGRETRHGQYIFVCFKFRHITEAWRSFRETCGTVCLMILKGKTVFHLLSCALITYFRDS